MLNALKSVFVGTARVVFNGLYKHHTKRQGQTREKLALFVSRQMDIPSENFRAVGDALECCGWKVVYHTKRLTKKTLVSYTAHVLQEIAYIARASVVILDRYDPVVSLLDVSCETSLVPSSQTGIQIPVGKPLPHDEHYRSVSSACVHRQFPVQPVVIQLWHAFGSFKKFGYQSLNTLEGHSAQTARIFRIHRNYSWVVCTSEENRLAFAEAFSIPPERVVPLGLPEFDTLVAKRANRESPMVKGALQTSCLSVPSDPMRVLFAPTLRKSSVSTHPFHDLEAWWEDHPSSAVQPLWSYHPLERGVGAATDVAFGLEQADIVVTDYSSLVYEAYVLGKPVLFYVPDIDAYRLSPGLNTDPLIRCPQLCFTDPSALQAALQKLAENPASYPQGGFDAFVGSAFSEASSQSAQRIAAFIDNLFPGLSSK